MTDSKNNIIMIMKKIKKANKKKIIYLLIITYNLIVAIACYFKHIPIYNK